MNEEIEGLDENIINMITKNEHNRFNRGNNGCFSRNVSPSYSINEDNKNIGEAINLE